MLFSFSGINLEVVILGQCTWKAPKKAIPPKETEKPESDFNLNFHLLFVPYNFKNNISFITDFPMSIRFELTNFNATSEIILCRSYRVKFVFKVTGMLKNLNIEDIEKQFFYLINARGNSTEFSRFSFPIYLAWAK